MYTRFPFEALFSSLVRRWRCSEAPGIPSFWNPLYFTPYTGLSLSASPVIFLRVQLEYMYVFMNNCTSMVMSLRWTQQLSFKYSYTLCVSMPTDVFVSYRLIHQRLTFKQTLTLELQSSETHNSEYPSFSKVLLGPFWPFLQLQLWTIIFRLRLFFLRPKFRFLYVFLLVRTGLWVK